MFCEILRWLQDDTTKQIIFTEMKQEYIHELTYKTQSSFGIEW